MATVAGIELAKPGSAIGRFPLKSFTFETVTVNRKGEIIQRESKQARYFTEDLGNKINLEMVYIPDGTFTMGSPETEKDSHVDEKPQPQVTIKPFLMGKYPVTQAQWQAVMGNNPSDFKGENRPVENVSWYDTIEFCARLLQKTGKSYRLPMTVTREHRKMGEFRMKIIMIIITKNIDLLVNIKNDERRRLLRGGSWNFFPDYCRSGSRSNNAPDDRFDSVGFRLVCAIAWTS